LNQSAADSSPDTPSPKTEQFLKLLGAHERTLFAYVYALSPNWQDAEEIMQRVRIRIWQQFDQYDVDKPFDAWARAIAYYLILAFRKEKSRQREFFSERILEAVSDKFDVSFDHANARRKALLQCLDKLDRQKRNLVYKYYSSPKPSTEGMAATLSMTPNALRQALFRIRRLLHACVQRTLRAEAHE
jgi:RNA polymerase sigma-70 factor (ECF subfamily)